MKEAPETISSEASIVEASTRIETDDEVLADLCLTTKALAKGVLSSILYFITNARAFSQHLKSLIGFQFTTRITFILSGTLVESLVTSI